LHTKAHAEKHRATSLTCRAITILSLIPRLLRILLLIWDSASGISLGVLKASADRPVKQQRKVAAAIVQRSVVSKSRLAQTTMTLSQTQRKAKLSHIRYGVSTICKSKVRPRFLRSNAE